MKDLTETLLSRLHARTRTLAKRLRVAGRGTVAEQLDRAATHIDLARGSLKTDHVFRKPNAKGCAFDIRLGKWKARGQSRGVIQHLGYFETEDAAHEAYVQFKRKQGLTRWQLEA